MAHAGSATPGASDSPNDRRRDRGLWAHRLDGRCPLSRCGVRVRILDKSQQQAHESRAFGVHAKSMELFLNMGLADEFLNRGLIATGVQVFVDGENMGGFNFDDIGRPDTPYSFLLMVPQWDIEAILVEDLRRLGVEVEHNVEVTGFEQSSQGVVVHAKDAAGASHRRLRFLPHRRRRCPQHRPQDAGTQLRGGCLSPGFPARRLQDRLAPRLRPHEVIPARACPGRLLAAEREGRGPHHRDRSRRSRTRMRRSRPRAPRSSRSTRWKSALRDASGLDVKLSDPVWTSRYRIHHRGVNKYGEGRVFVAGDAAHIHSPAGGQGMNTGLQDAANLAWKLALVLKGHAPGHLLDTYHSERWPVGQKVLNYTDKLFAGMSSQSGWVARLRNMLVPLLAATLSRSGTIRARAFHFCRSSAFATTRATSCMTPRPSDAPRAWRDGLVAGRRAPNGLIARNRDVFGLTQGYGFHVLALSRTPLSREEIRSLSEKLAGLPRSLGIELETHIIAHSLIGRDERILQAESPQVFQAYGITDETPQALFFIRPDGYIAYRTDSLDVEGLGEFIRQRFGSSPSALCSMPRPWGTDPLLYEIGEQMIWGAVRFATGIFTLPEAIALARPCESELLVGHGVGPDIAGRSR